MSPDRSVIELRSLRITRTVR